MNMTLLFLSTKNQKKRECNWEVKLRCQKNNLFKLNHNQVIMRRKEVSTIKELRNQKKKNKVWDNN